MARTALLAALLLLPALALPVGADAPRTTSQTACLLDQDLVLCATATLTLQLDCRRVDPGHVACDAPLNWTTAGHSTLLLPGSVQHAASANLEWCRPGAFCQSYGVGFLIASCSWTLPLPAGCSDTGPFNLYPGPIPLDQGLCMDVTLSGFTRADGYVGPAFGRPAVTATTTNEVRTTFCG